MLTYSVVQHWTEPLARHKYIDLDCPLSWQWLQLRHLFTCSGSLHTRLFTDSCTMLLACDRFVFACSTGLHPCWPELLFTGRRLYDEILGKMLLVLQWVCDVWWFDISSSLPTPPPPPFFFFFFFCALCVLCLETLPDVQCFIPYLCLQQAASTTETVCRCNCYNVHVLWTVPSLTLVLSWCVALVV